MLGKYGKILTIITIILALGLIVFFILKDKPEEEGPLSESACEGIRTKIAKEIDKMNYCETKNDCVLLNGCAYGCNNLINKNADMAKFVDLEATYVGECDGVCETNCSNALRPNEIICEDKKCASTRE